MRLSLPDSLKPAPHEPRVVLLPTDRFFVRTVPLAPEGDPAAQVELALEGLAPFPVAQLYYGFVPAPDRTSALVFAAYRRRFTVDETAAWSEADVVLPAFAAWLAAPPQFANATLHADGPRLAGLTWGGRGALPTGVLGREFDLPAPGEGEAAPVTTPEQREAFGAEVRRSVEPAPESVRWLEGPTTVAFGASEGTFVFTTPGAGGSAPLTVEFAAGQLATMDVRDKGVLAARARAKARALVLWRVFVGCAAAVATALVLELALLSGGFWLKTRKAQVVRQTPEVQKIMTARTMALRVEELSTKRLLPFVMLDLINGSAEKPIRPRTMLFTNVRTDGHQKLVIDARTSNSMDVGNYVAALKGLAGVVADAALTNQQTRGGQTTFTLTVQFRPEALQKGGRA
jgi:hypothetical protein